MAQSASCNLSNSIPISKSWVMNPNSQNSPKFPKFTSVRAMAAGARRESLDHLQRAGVNKRREGPATPVGLWDRFPTERTVQQMMDTMERLRQEPAAFTTTWQSPPSPPPSDGGYVRGRAPWEIKEGEAEYKVRFDMPGMTKEDVKVWVEEKMLVIRAEKMPRKKDGLENGNGNGNLAVEEEEDWPAKSFGKYGTRIALPANVDFEKIKAEVKDGVLYVTIPKASPASKIFDINVQ